MNAVIDAVWKRVVGGLDWLKQVVFGEFDDHRDTSAVVADMLVSFVPGVIIVTSARDLTAVIVRMAKHPEKREHVEEWMLVIACAVPLVLPILAAAAGAAAAGVGAIIGGVGGSEAGAALRAVCLLLIKEGSHALVEIVGFMRRFIKGDILKVLRDMRFAKYSHSLAKYIGEFIGKLNVVIRRVRGELLKLDAFHWLDEAIQKLDAMEHAFYGVQQTALRAIPRALMELDARLQHALTEALPHQPRLAHAGVPANVVRPIRAESQRVSAMSGSRLGHANGTQPPRIPARAAHSPNVHPESPREPRLTHMPETRVDCFELNAAPPAMMTPRERLEQHQARIAEMDRQLAGQQAGLNDMTAQQYLDGRQAFATRRDATGSGRESNGPARRARRDFSATLVSQLQTEYRSRGISQAVAQARARAEAREQMRTLAALHNPDQVVGGRNVIGGMGDKPINSSIGSSWSGGRANQMDAAARAIPPAQRATTRMNVKLERCP